MSSNNDDGSDSRNTVLMALPGLVNFASGKNLSSCREGPVVGEEEACYAGPVVADALVRYYSQSLAPEEEGNNNNNNNNSTTTATTAALPYVVVPELNYLDYITNLHPDQWGVHATVLKDLLGWKFYMTNPSNLGINPSTDDYDRSRQRNITALQDLAFPSLLSDVSLTPMNSFWPYHRNIYFDHDTLLAIMYFDARSNPAVIGIPRADASIALTRYVARVNRENGCFQNNSQLAHNNNNSKPGNPPGCWTPVLFLKSPGWNPGFFERYLQQVTTNATIDSPPPALIVNLVANMPEADHKPIRYGNDSTWAPWIVSASREAGQYLQFQLTRSSISTDNNDPTRLANVTVLQRPYPKLPEQAVDGTYRKNVAAVAALTQEAFRHNPIAGYTTTMPPIGVTCRHGECAIGNLLADAYRWNAGAQVAFLSAGPMRGVGWEAGPIDALSLWSTFPFPVTLCQGVMSGISLFELAEYSTRVSKFFGGRWSKLLQVSGMRLTYNANIPQDSSRLLALDVWNETTQAYEPVQRLTMYSFVTNSYECGSHGKFPALTVSDLVIEGEVPGVIGSESALSATIAYMNTFHAKEDQPYNTTLQGRLINDTSSTDVMNLVQMPENCTVSTTYNAALQSCLPCPKTNNIVWVGSNFEFHGETGSTKNVTSTASLVNGAVFPVNVGPKSLPSWLEITEAKLNEDEELGNIFVKDAPFLLNAGSRLSIDYQVSARNLEPGSAHGQVAFRILDGGLHVGCEGLDATFDVIMRVDPTPEMNYIGNVRYLGFTLAAIVVLSAVGLAIWVVRNSFIPTLTKMQPSFLYILLTGVGIIGCAMIMLGIDDQIAPDNVCDFSCQATPWLLSIGFSLSCAALFSKLLRVNKLLNAGSFVRRKITAKDVLLWGSVMLSLNVVVLVLWTIIDPLTWQRLPVNGEEWNTYGSCKSEGVAGDVFLGLTISVNLATLLLAVWQAFKARNLPSELSESKYVGIAVLCWLQLLMVGLPVIFLIDDDDTLIKYVLQIALIFAVCGSMLGLIFVPIIQNVHQYILDGGSDHFTTAVSEHSRGRVHISGFEDPGTSSAPLHVQRSSSMAFESSLKNQNSTTVVPKTTDDGPTSSSGFSSRASYNSNVSVVGGSNDETEAKDPVLSTTEGEDPEDRVTTDKEEQKVQIMTKQKHQEDSTTTERKCQDGPTVEERECQKDPTSHDQFCEAIIEEPATAQEE